MHAGRIVDCSYIQEHCGLYMHAGRIVHACSNIVDWCVCAKPTFESVPLTNVVIIIVIISMMLISIIFSAYRASSDRL